jgi:hypothetical protein
MLYQKRIMSVTKTHFDGILVSKTLNADCPIYTAYGIFVQDMLIIGGTKIHVWHLKKSHVPTALAIRTSDETTATTIYGWFHYALASGFAKGIEDVFPYDSISEDFDKEDLTDGIKSDLSILQNTVDILEQTFSTDSERVLAVQQLQDQITSNDSDIAAEIVARSNAITAEQSARATAIDAEKLRAETEEKSIQDDVDANEAVASTDRGLVRTEFAAEDLLLKNRLDVLEVDPTTKAQVDAVQTDLDSKDSVAQTDRALVRTEFASEDSLLKGRLDTLELDPISASSVTTQIAAAKTELLGAPSSALDTLQELGAALSNDADYAVTITTALSEKSAKVAPVFSGSHAVFQGGLEFANGQQCQGKDFVGIIQLLFAVSVTLMSLLVPLGLVL